MAVTLRDLRQGVRRDPALLGEPLLLEEAAPLIGVSAAQLSRIEHGLRGLVKHRAVRMAKAYKVPLAEVLKAKRHVQPAK